MEKIHARMTALVICLTLALTSLSACASDGNGTGGGLSTGKVEVEKDEKYGNTAVKMSIDEFNAIGFNYGDSVDAKFSNGYSLEDIPYYNGYYASAGEPLIVAYPGSDSIVVAINYGASWEEAGLKAGDTVEITLNRAGKYADIQEIMGSEYVDDREAYGSDEIFANFRSINMGRLREDVLYRSASPCDNAHNRAPYVDDLAESAGIRLIVDLADSSEDIDGFMGSSDFDSPYFRSLYDAGSVISADMNADYMSDDFKTRLTGALRIMSKTDGPYLIHCLEGKDRTGFVCALLEALAGADYEDITADYMISYENYYGVDPKKDTRRYETILNTIFVPMLRCIAGVDDRADLKGADMEAGAREYLMSGGMSAEEIDALKDRLTR